MTLRQASAIAICYLIGIAVYSFDPVMQSFPSIFVNDFMKTFAVSSIGVGVIASAYFYSYNLLQIPFGLFCDRVGTKNIVIFSSLICMLGLTLFSQAHSLHAAIASRIIMGVGGSCAAVVMIVICKEYFSVVWLPFLIGVAQLACNVGALSGQYPLTFLSSAVGWRHTVLFLNVIPVILLVAAMLFLNRKSKATTQHHYLHELKAVFSNKHNWVIGGYAMLLWTPFYTFASLWGIPFLQEKFNINVTEASRLIAITWIGSGVGSILLGFLSSYLRERKMCILLSAGIGLLAFPFLIFGKATLSSSYEWVLFIFGIASAGQALSFAMIDDHNAKDVLGTASGLNNTIIMIGPMLIDPIVGALLKWHWNGAMQSGVAFYSVDCFVSAFMVIPILFLGAIFVGILYHDKLVAVKRTLQPVYQE